MAEQTVSSQATAGTGATGLVDVLDTILDTGVAVAGDIVISLAGVDLLYVNLRALVASVETVLELDERS